MIYKHLCGQNYAEMNTHFTVAGQSGLADLALPQMWTQRFLDDCSSWNKMWVKCKLCGCFILLQLA